MSLGSDRWSKAHAGSESFLADSPWPTLSLCPSCVTPSLLLVQTVQKSLSCAFRMQSFSPGKTAWPSLPLSSPLSSASGNTNRGIQPLLWAPAQLLLRVENGRCQGHVHPRGKGVTDASGSLLKAGGSLLREKKKCTCDVGHEDSREDITFLLHSPSCC